MTEGLETVRRDTMKSAYEYLAWKGKVSHVREDVIIGFKSL